MRAIISVPKHRKRCVAINAHTTSSLNVRTPNHAKVINNTKPFRFPSDSKQCKKRTDPKQRIQRNPFGVGNQCGQFGTERLSNWYGTRSTRFAMHNHFAISAKLRAVGWTLNGTSEPERARDTVKSLAKLAHSCYATAEAISQKSKQFMFEIVDVFDSLTTDLKVNKYIVFDSGRPQWPQQNAATSKFRMLASVAISTPKFKARPLFEHGLSSRNYFPNDSKSNRFAPTTP